MLRHGSPVWLPWLFGAACVPAGLLLWHRLGPKFGLGEARGEVRPGVAWQSLVVCVLLWILALIVGGE
jgi:hypothetical protein